MRQADKTKANAGVPCMKLIIHIGLHKTATTSFQQLCRRNPEELHRCGIHYPNRPEQYQHSWLAWMVQKKKWEEVKHFLEKALQESLEANVAATLISGEDFENLLVDWHEAQALEEIIWRTGFREILWIVVTRPSHEYYESLYSELSKHDFALDYAKAAEAILNHGQLTAMNASYCYRFVFDLDRYLKGFKRAVTGRVEHIQYEDFIKGYPGLRLLQIAGASEQALTMLQQKGKAKADNARLDAVTAENNYIANFLGVRRTDVEAKVSIAHLREIREQRLDLIESIRKELRDRFIAAFDTDQTDAQNP